MDRIGFARRKGLPARRAGALLALLVAAGPVATATPAAAAPRRTQAPAPIVREAEAFMAAYAADLRAGDRAAIADRYDRRGAWRLGNGEKSFDSWEGIRTFYASAAWERPSSFAWRDLSFEPMGRDSVLVAGLFEWGAGEGRPPVTVSYTGVLVRQGGKLRIRLEDESAKRPAAGRD
jgi:hypothetical protein